MKSILKFLIVAVAVGSAGVAGAQSASSSLPRPPRPASTTPGKSPMKQLLEEKKEAREERREENKEAIMEMRAKIASSTMQFKMRIASTTKDLRDKIVQGIKIRKDNRYEKMLERFKATIERETSIMEKINSRISKIKATGGNTTEAEALVASAKTHLDEAVNGLAELTTLADAQSSQELSSTTRETWKNRLDSMREVGREIEMHLREAHQSLQKTVGNLRGMSQLRPATTTPTVATSTATTTATTTN